MLHTCFFLTGWHPDGEAVSVMDTGGVLVVDGRCVSVMDTGGMSVMDTGGLSVMDMGGVSVMDTGGVSVMDTGGESVMDTGCSSFESLVSREKITPITTTSCVWYTGKAHEQSK